MQLDGPFHQIFGQPLEPGIGGEAEGVGQAVFLADFVHPRQAKARIGADVDGDIGPLLRSALTTRIRSSSAPSEACTVPGRSQARKTCLACRLADDQREILVLPEVPVKERQLLVAVGRVIGGVQIERDRRGQRAAVLLLETLDAGGDVEVDQLLQHRGRGQVLKAAERRLAGQRLSSGRRSAISLKTGSSRSVSWSLQSS